MPRLRDLHSMVAVVATAEGMGWDQTHPVMLKRARDRLWAILWATDRAFASLVYGEV